MVIKRLVYGAVAYMSTSVGSNLPPMVEAEANQELVGHPIVQASANVVVIDDKSVPNDYFGPMYIGSNMVPLKISYDTLSDWTVISNQSYNVMASETQSPWVSINGDPVTENVKFLKFDTTGSIYNESMCLIHQAEAADRSKSRLCVSKMPFVYAELDSDDNTYQGMLGLARGNSQQINFVKLLYMQGSIKAPIVSLNYEDPMDSSQISQVAFGEVLYSEVEGG